MGNLTVMAVFVVALNVLMFLSQAAIIDINPEATKFFNEEGSLINEFDAGGNVLDTAATTDRLPSAPGSISPTTGNIFTDTFSAIRNWFFDSTGISYLLNILSAPYNMLKALNLPNAFVFAIGSLWYIISLFVVVAFLLGGDK